MNAYASYGHFELTQSLTDNPWSVRDEAASRHNVLARQMATAKRKIERLAAEMAKLETLHNQALAEIAKETATA